MKIKSDLDNVKFCEAYGIMMGDGCISDYINNYEHRRRVLTCVTGNSKKDYVYMTNYVTPLFNNIFGTNVHARINKTKNVVEYISSKKSVFEWFKNNGFPVGLKEQVGIPKSILKKSKMSINAVIRGIFDTDGCTFARRDEDYRYPYINISSHSKVLLSQLKELLNAQGYPAYIHAHGVYVRGIKNFKRWFKEIGSKNPRNLIKYEEFLNTGKIVPCMGR